MKYIKASIQVLLLALYPLLLPAQDCVGYHELGDCQMDKQRQFKVYSQSKSFIISAMDTVDLNIVFYGQKDYILSFCTHSKFYPVRFQLIEPGTDKVLYDNMDDKYIESLGIGFDVTKALTIRVNVLARKASEEEIENYIGCLGLLIQYKSYPEKKVKLQM